MGEETEIPLPEIETYEVSNPEGWIAALRRPGEPDTYSVPLAFGKTSEQARCKAFTVISILKDDLSGGGPDYGEIMPEGTLIMRQSIGTFQNEDGEDAYKAETTMTGVPLIHSKKTGKYFALQWQDILKLARKAGIDDEE